MIEISDKAATEVKRVMSEKHSPEETVYLRIRVVGGGCSGFQNKLDLDTEKSDRDEVFEVNGIKVVIDNRSILYLGGATVDFYDELSKRGFIVNSPAITKGSCACGSAGHY